MGLKKHKTWSKDITLRTIMLVRNKEIFGFTVSLQLYERPKSTLKDQVNRKQQSIEKLFNFRIGRKIVLPKILKYFLVSHCLIIDFFYPTTNDFKRMALRLAIKNDNLFVKVSTNSIKISHVNSCQSL